jgi:hypothetical protein
VTPDEIRKLADRLMVFPHPSDCDVAHEGAVVLRALADVVEAARRYGNMLPDDVCLALARLMDLRP